MSENTILAQVLENLDALQDLLNDTEELVNQLPVTDAHSSAGDCLTQAEYLVENAYGYLLQSVFNSLPESERHIKA